MHGRCRALESCIDLPEFCRVTRRRAKCQTLGQTLGCEVTSGTIRPNICRRHLELEPATAIVFAQISVGRYVGVKNCGALNDQCLSVIAKLPITDQSVAVRKEHRSQFEGDMLHNFGCGKIRLLCTKTGFIVQAEKITALQRLVRSVPLPRDRLAKRPANVTSRTVVV